MEEALTYRLNTYSLRAERRRRVCSRCGEAIGRRKLHYTAYNRVSCGHPFHSIPLCLNCAGEGKSSRDAGPARTFTFMKLANGLNAKLLNLEDPALSRIAKACKKIGVFRDPRGRLVLEVNVNREKIFAILFTDFPEGKILAISQTFLDVAAGYVRLLVYDGAAHPLLSPTGNILMQAIRLNQRPSITALIAPNRE